MHHPRPIAEFRRCPDPGRMPELERLGDEITELAAHIHAATFQLLELIAEFDEQGGWELDGIHSCAHWLNWKCGTNLGAAREKVRVARALPELPKISAAFRAGCISYSKVRAMTRVATQKNEDFLLHVARHGTAAHVESVVRNYRRTRRLQALENENHRHAQRELSWFQDGDDMWVFKGRFTPEQGALIEKALEQAMDLQFAEQQAEDDRSGWERSPLEEEPPAGLPSWERPHPIATRRADALERVAESYLAGKEAKRSGGERYLLHVHTHSDTLQADGKGAEAELEDGSRVSAETWYR